jgi:hypothetical protein
MVYVGGRYVYGSIWYLSIFEFDLTTGYLYQSLLTELSGALTNIEIQTMSEDTVLLGGCVGMFTSSATAYIGTVVY